MNKSMLKRTISIGLLMSMSFVLAAPMLHIECDMPCCQVEKMTCCEAKQEKSLEKTCRIDMKSCDMGGVFIPIIAGPFHQDNLNIELNIQNSVEANSFIPSFENNYNPVLLDHLVDPPPVFNLPLLL